MGALELVMAGIILPMLYMMVTKVGFNYQAVGQSLDVLGVPGVQERVIVNENNATLMQRVVNRYLFLTRMFPLAAAGVGIICVALYLSLKGSAVSGNEVSAEWVGFCSLVIGGAFTWLITFEPAPDWLYESHVIVLLTKSKIDLEVILAALKEIESKAHKGKELTDDEIKFINIQCTMLTELAKDVEATVRDLEQQKQELIDNA